MYCTFEDCSFAHQLSELRAPHERDQHYDQAWKEGVDGWYGQIMTKDQISIIKRYLRDTPLRDAPAWVNGLRYATDAKHLDEDHYIQWDYGLSMDLEMLCNHRRGRVPFEFMPHLWTILYGA